MVYNFLPFMIYPIYSILIKIDENYITAAGDLGANPRQAFTKITFPLSIPGVITGITMVFMPAVSTFVIPSLLGGGQNMLIGNLIEQQLMQAGNWHFGSAASLIMMTIILLAMQFMNRFDKTQQKIWRCWHEKSVAKCVSLSYVVVFICADPRFNGVFF